MQVLTGLKLLFNEISCATKTNQKKPKSVTTFITLK